MKHPLMATMKRTMMPCPKQKSAEDPVEASASLRNEIRALKVETLQKLLGLVGEMLSNDACPLMPTFELASELAQIHRQLVERRMSCMPTWWRVS